MSQTWDLWIPDVASRGLSFGRAVMEPFTNVLVHSSPASLRVEIRDDDGNLIAFGDHLLRSAESPMTRLVVSNGQVRRTDVWPTDADLGLPVILPGGEVGILQAWWHAADHSEWRWTVEFYNHR